MGVRDVLTYYDLHLTVLAWQPSCSAERYLDRAHKLLNYSCACAEANCVIEVVDPTMKGSMAWRIYDILNFKINKDLIYKTFFETF